MISECLNVSLAPNTNCSYFVKPQDPLRIKEIPNLCSETYLFASLTTVAIDLKQNEKDGRRDIPTNRPIDS